MTFDDILNIQPYSLNKDEKEALLTKRLIDLTNLHKEKCKLYEDILEADGFNVNQVNSYKDIPFLPVRLFKERSLKSVEDGEVVKTMTSSGTSGQSVSKIYLDRTTSSNQQKTMVKIVSDFTGSSRMPMIIIDCPSVVKDRKMFSARGAGILGFSIFGSKKIYALDDDMHLQFEELKSFIEQYRGQKILLFGFTFMIWQHFYKELVRIKKETGDSLDLSNAILIHGGGWKKLITEAVSPTEFHDSLKSVCGFDSIHDYYGMVEQTGCIYMQCECGHLHASIFSDVIIRNPLNYNECKIGEKGIIQVVSTIPESYPGHSLLTEDEGMILGEDDCPCGRKGKYFRIFGRLKNAEIRGCSDTYAADHSINGENVEKKIQFLVGDENALDNMPNVAPMLAFNEKITDFLSDLSKELMKNSEAKAYADIISLGFWLRKSSINTLKHRFLVSDGDEHLGRGVAFHISPSNVPVNFAYSLFSGLLCGNANIVRVPSKEFPQVSIIVGAINKALEKYEYIKPYICLVKYERDSEVNRYLSSMCDVRVIWGGDATIAELRKAPLSPRATELTFSDRYSLTLIDSDYYVENADKERLAVDFYNDTYLTDQNACTSPRVVVWIGNNIDNAKKIFWDELYELVTNRYFFQPIMAVDKLTQRFLLASDDCKICESHLVRSQKYDNTIVRVSVDNLSPQLMNYRGNCGYFYEYDCKDTLEIRDFCDDTRCQTIGVIGDREIIRPLIISGIKGVDRVTNVGHTMDFDLKWDGYNLVDRLTRTVSIT